MWEKEHISEEEDRLVEITDVEQKREKKIEKKWRVSEKSGTKLSTTTPVLQGCQKEKRERKGHKEVFEAIIAKNFAEKGKDPFSQIH